MNQPTGVLMSKGILWIGVLVMMLSSVSTFASDIGKAYKTKEKISLPKSNLRCWQQGKLLFDESDWNSFTIANKDNVLNFTNDENSNQTLSIIDMGDTVCLYKKPN